MLKKCVMYMMATVMAFGFMGMTMTAEAKELKLCINDKKVQFTEDLGHPFIDTNNRTQIPFRAFSEASGSEVSWDKEERVGYAKQNGSTIAIPVGEYYIIKDGKKIPSDTENIIINNRIHIPLRIVMESFDKEVDWDAENWTINVTDGGSKQNPTEPTKPVEQPKPAEPVGSGAVSAEALRGVKIGDSVSTLTSKLGQPARKDTSIYGFQWYVYNSSYSEYIQVGVSGDKVVALYTNASYWKLSESVKYGASTSSLQGFGAKSSGDTYVATKNNISYTFYVDKLAGNKAAAVLLMDASIKTNSYYGTASTALRTGFEKQVFDLTNVERLNQGLSVLKWREDVSGVARLHSEDMMKQNYFAHTNKQGQQPWDRAKQAGVSYSYFGENIAMGQKNALEVVNGWMNSDGHRKNILSGNFNGLGVGVAFASNNSPYYTQNFIK